MTLSKILNNRKNNIMNPHESITQTQQLKTFFIMGFPLWSSGLRLCTFIAEGTGSIPGQGTKIPQAEWCSQKNKKIECLNFFKGTLNCYFCFLILKMTENASINHYKLKA